MRFRPALLLVDFINTLDFDGGEKLRRRAARIVAEITGKTTGVDEALEKCGYDVRTACIMLVRQVGQEDATKALIAAKGSLRKALSPS